jgi:hypothetical protein
LKNVLQNSEVLAFPRFDLPFYLAVDSSAQGIGYVLYQKHLENSDEKVRFIRFGSCIVGAQLTIYRKLRL